MAKPNGNTSRKAQAILGKGGALIFQRCAFGFDLDARKKAVIALNRSECKHHRRAAHQRQIDNITNRGALGFHVLPQ